MNASRFKISAYDVILKNIIKNNIFIFFLMFVEFIQIFTDTMRFSVQLSSSINLSFNIFNNKNSNQAIINSSINNNDSDNSVRYSDEDNNSVINYFKYLTINWQIKKKFLKCHEIAILYNNIHDFNNLNNKNNNCIFAYNYSVLIIILTILTLFSFFFLFDINKEAQLKRNNLKMLEKSTIIALSNQSQSYQSDIHEFNKKNFDIFRFILVNMFEIIFHAFGAIIIDIFINILFYSLFNIFHFSNIIYIISSLNLSSGIYYVLASVSLISFILYLILNIQYIHLLEITFRFSKEFFLYKETYLSKRFDKILLLSRIVFSIENNLRYCLVANESLFTFIYVFHFFMFVLLLIYYMINFSFRRFIFITNKEYNRIRLYLLFGVIFLYFDDIIFRHNYQINFFTLQNLSAVFLCSIFLTETILLMNSSRLLGLANTPSGIIYQLYFIFDYYYHHLDSNREDNSSIFSREISVYDIEKQMLKILIRHKYVCKSQYCKINQINMVGFKPLLLGFLNEIENPHQVHKINKQDMIIIPILRIIAYDLINIYEDTQKKKKFTFSSYTLVNKISYNQNHNLNVTKNDKSEEKLNIKNKQLNDLNSDMSNGQNQMNIIQIIYSAFRFVSKKRIDESFIFILNMHINHVFYKKQKQFLCFEILNQYLDINKKLQKSLFFIEEAISCIKSKNFQSMINLLFSLKGYEEDINKSFSILVKNKTTYIDHYSLYISTYLFREIFNSKLTGEQDIIFSSEINTQINNNFNSDNYIILSTNKKLHETHNLENIYGKYQRKKSNICFSPEYEKYKYNNETFRIIKAANKFIVYKNKNLDNLFPLKFRNKIIDEFKHAISQSDGNVFRYKTVMEFESYKVDQNEKSISRKLTSNAHNPKSDNTGIAKNVLLKLFENQNKIKSFKNLNSCQNEINDEKSYFNLSTINSNNPKNDNQSKKDNPSNKPNAVKEVEKKISLKTYNYNNITNQFENIIKEKENNLKICLMESRIFPSLSMHEMLLISNIATMPEEIIIFEEDEKLQTESLYTLSTKLAKYLNIPFEYLPQLKNNEFTFDRLFKLYCESNINNQNMIEMNTHTNQYKNTNNHMNTNKENKKQLKNTITHKEINENINQGEYHRYLIKEKDYEKILVNFIEKLIDKDLINLDDQKNAHILKFYQNKSSLIDPKKFSMPNVESKIIITKSTIQNLDFIGNFLVNNTPNNKGLNLYNQETNNSSNKFFWNPTIYDDENINAFKRTVNKKNLHLKEPLNNNKLLTNETKMSFSSSNFNMTFNGDNVEDKSKNNKKKKAKSLQIALVDTIKTPSFKYRIYKIKINSNKKNESKPEFDNSSYLSNEIDRNFEFNFNDNLICENDGTSLINYSGTINNALSETSFTLNIFENEADPNKSRETTKNINYPIYIRLVKQRDSNLKKIYSYLYFILFLIGVFVVAGIVILVSGILYIKKISELFELNSSFNQFTNHFYHTGLSIIMNVIIYRENSVDISNYFTADFYEKFRNFGVKMSLPDYFLKEVEIKLDELKSKSVTMKNLIYEVNDSEITDLILNQKIDFFYIYKSQTENSHSNIDVHNNNLRISSKKMSFFEVLDVYHSFAHIGLENPNVFTNVYIIDNSNLDFSLHNFWELYIDKYQNAVYHIIINYQNIITLFEIYKEYSYFKLQKIIVAFYDLILAYYIVLNLCHLILIVISLATMIIFRQIISQNICIMEFMLEGENANFLMKKIKKLKILSELYLENPYDLIKKILKSKKNFYSTQTNVNNTKNNKSNFLSSLTDKNGKLQHLKNPTNKNLGIMKNSDSNNSSINKEENVTTNKNPSSNSNNTTINFFNIDKSQTIRQENHRFKIYLKEILFEKYIYIKQSKLLNQFYNVLWIVFVGYYIYSFILFFVFYKINDQVNFYNNLSEKKWITTHDLNNNAMMLAITVLLNQSDYTTTKIWEQTNKKYNPIFNPSAKGISSQNKNNFYLFTKLNNIYKNNFFSIKDEKNSEFFQDFNNFNYDYIDCDFIYNSYNDDLIGNMERLYNSTFKNIRNDLAKACKLYSVNNEKNVYLINEELTYQNKYLYRNYEFRDFSYSQDKMSYDDFIFFDLFTILILITRPITDYIYKGLIYPIVNMTINDYLIFNICYLVLNFLIDILLLYMINKKIIRKVFMLNDNFKNMMKTLKI